jgi:hypothetical protein
MGTDVHVVLGRVKPEACRLQLTTNGVVTPFEPRPEDLTPEAIDAFCPAVPDPASTIAPAPLKPEDFEFLSVNSEAEQINGNLPFEIDRDYVLFDWLSNYGRSDIRPHIGWQQHRDAAKRFGAFMNTGKPTWLDLSWKEEFRRNESFTERYYEGWGGVTLIPVSWFLSYDYDQVAEVIAVNSSYTDCEGVYHDLDTYMPHPVGLTYRQLLGGKDNNFFPFIEAAKAGNWDFIIFTYGG